MFGKYTVTPSLDCNLLLKANDPLQIHKQMCHCFSIHSLLQCRDGKITVRRAACLPRSIPLLDVMLTTSFSLPLFTSLCRIHSRCQPRMDVTVAVFCSPLLWIIFIGIFVVALFDTLCTNISSLFLCLSSSHHQSCNKARR